MPEAVHSTFAIKRSYPKPPQRVFAAFADPARKRRWFAESDNHDVDLFETDFRVGGVERTSYRLRPGTPFPGAIMATEGRFLSIIPDSLIVISQAMDFADRRISAALVTFELKPSTAGTDLVCTHQAVFFEGADGPEMRKQGWTVLLESLAREMER